MSRIGTSLPASVQDLTGINIFFGRPLTSIERFMFVLLLAIHIMSLCAGIYVLVRRARRFYQLRRRNSMRGLFSVQRRWMVTLAVCVLTLVSLSTWRTQNSGFPSSMQYGVFGLLLVLEVWPCVVLLEWRSAITRGQWIPVYQATALATITTFQIGFVTIYLLLSGITIVQSF